MKNFTLIFACLLCVVGSLHAQTPKYGVFIGINSSNLRFSDYSGSVNLKSTAGLRVSGVVEYDFSERISFMALPGISMKGAKILSEKLSLTYLDIPVYGVYNYEIGPGKAMGGFGPYVGVALFGKVAGEKIEFGEEDGIKRADAGVNFMLGYEFSELGLRAMFTVSPGIADISSGTGVKTRNTGIGFGVAYMLKR